MRNLLTTALILYLLTPFSILSQHNNSELPTSINEDGSAPDKSAILHLQSTDQGLLIPRLPFCDIEEINDPAEGLMIYDTEYHCLRIFIQGTWNCLYERGALSDNRLSLTGWSSTPLDEGFDTDIDIDNDENLYITTSTEDREIRLKKYDKKGNLQWSIFENCQYLTSVEVDQNGNSFSVAYVRDFPFEFNGQVISSAPQFSNIIIKTSSDGTTSSLLAMNKGFNLSASKIDPDDNFVLAYCEHSNANDPDVYRIEKFDTNLNLIWSKHLDNLLSVGYNSIDIDSNGDIYVAVSYYSGGPISNFFNDPVGVNNIYVTKINGQTGQFIWERNISNVASLKVDNIFVVEDDVFVIGSYDLEAPYYIGTTFFIQRYGQGLGQTRLYSEFDRQIGVRGSDVSASDKDMCLSVLEVVNNVLEDKLLFISLQSHEIINEKDVKFRGGPLVYNVEGNRIYGIGRGDKAGNTVITSAVQGENNIVFKLQKN